MAKPQTQLSEVITTEESPSYKKERMKEVRSLVAAAVKHNQRVDLMGFSGTDIARSQIALQDLLWKSQERHDKATSLVQRLRGMGLFAADMLDSAATRMVNDQERVGDLSMALREERESHMQTASLLDVKIREIEGLKLALKGVMNG